MAGTCIADGENYYLCFSELVFWDLLLTDMYFFISSASCPASCDGACTQTSDCSGGNVCSTSLTPCNACIDPRKQQISKPFVFLVIKSEFTFFPQLESLATQQMWQRPALHPMSAMEAPVSFQVCFLIYFFFCYQEQHLCSMLSVSAACPSGQERYCVTGTTCEDNVCKIDGMFQKYDFAPNLNRL